MRGAARVAGLLGLLVGVGIGCHRRPAPVLEANAQGSEIAIRVVSRNFSDMVIYLEQNGQRTRIGEASGETTTLLFLPWLRISTNPEIRLLAVPIGARGYYLSDHLHLRPGSLVVLRLDNDLSRSTYEVY